MPVNFQYSSPLYTPDNHTEDISIFQLDVPENAYKKYNYYEPHRFIIEVKNSNEIQKESIYENITIKH